MKERILRYVEDNYSVIGLSKSFQIANRVGKDIYVSPDHFYDSEIKKIFGLSKYERDKYLTVIENWYWMKQNEAIVPVLNKLIHRGITVVLKRDCWNIYDNLRRFSYDIDDYESVYKDGFTDIDHNIFEIVINTYIQNEMTRISEEVFKNI